MHDLKKCSFEEYIFFLKSTWRRPEVSLPRLNDDEEPDRLPNLAVN